MLDICDRVYTGSVTQKLRPLIAINSFILVQSSGNAIPWRSAIFKGEWYMRPTEYKIELDLYDKQSEKYIEQKIW